MVDRGRYPGTLSGMQISDNEVPSLPGGRRDQTDRGEVTGVKRRPRSGHRRCKGLLGPSRLSSSKSSFYGERLGENHNKERIRERNRRNSRRWSGKGMSEPTHNWRVAGGYGRGTARAWAPTMVAADLSVILIIVQRPFLIFF